MDGFLRIQGAFYYYQSTVFERILFIFERKIFIASHIFRVLTLVLHAADCGTEVGSKNNQNPHAVIGLYTQHHEMTEKSFECFANASPDQFDLKLIYISHKKKEKNAILLQCW